MSHYVITGASGHIGNNLVRYINRTQPDTAVTVLVRRLIDRELAGTLCHQAVGDLGDGGFLRRHITADCVVVHLACTIDLSDKHPENTYRVNVEYTKLICNVCRKVGCRFIYVGSVDAIPKIENDSVIKEPACFDPDRVEGHYGKSKAIATQYVMEAMAAYPTFSAAIVMPSAVIGPHDYKPSAVGRVIGDTLQGKPAFGILGGYNFVFVEDVCRAIVTLAKGNQRDVYIISGDNVTVEEMYAAIFTEMSGHHRPIILPVSLAQLCIPFVPVLNPITLKALQDPHCYSNQKAAAAWGYAATPFSQAMKQTVAWFRSYLKE